MNVLSTFYRFSEPFCALLLGWGYPQLKPAFSVDSHLTLRERVKLYQLALGKKIIVEIGSYLGASACCFAAALRQGSAGGRVYCIDTWENHAMSEGRRDTYDWFRANTAAYEDVIVPVRGLSTEVAHVIAERINKVDLLFFDGDHSYPGVFSDWCAYKRFFKPGTVVVFHDYGWAEGVQRVIREEVVAWVSRSENLPNLWWATVEQVP